MDPFIDQPDFLEAFRAGEARALDKVYRVYHQPLRQFISRGFSFKSDGRAMYFNGFYAKADIEDIIHETFRRAFGERARNSYDGVRPYKNYLFTIARNAVMTDLAAKQRQIPVGEALMRDTPVEEMSPLEHWVMSRRAIQAEEPECSQTMMEHLELYGLVRSFLEQLSPEDRTFFEVRFLASQSQEKTAQRMGWNRARVRKNEAQLRRTFLASVCGCGYLEERPEGRMVRRVADREAQAQLMARSRELWRSRSAHEDNEFLLEAA